MKKILLALCLFVLSASSQILEWDRNPPQEKVTGYRVYRGTSSREYSKTIDVGNSIQYPLGPTIPGKPEFFAATAYGPDGESEFSDEVSFTPRAIEIPNDPLFLWNEGNNRVPYDQSYGLSRSEFQWPWYNPGGESSTCYNTHEGWHIEVFDEPGGFFCSNIAEAWLTVAGAPDIVVAMIELYFETSHPDLAGRFLPGAKFVDGVFSEGVEGLPINAHGPMGAGIIGAIGNNGIGIVGVLRDSAKILPIGVKTLEDIGPAIHYAVDHGARIINFAWGEYTSPASWREAFQYAHDHGVIIVCAAIEGLPTPALDYPALWVPELDNIILVGGHTKAGDVWPDSGWQHTGYIHLLAPGRLLVTTYYTTGFSGDGWRYTSGTSFATAFVSGAAALVWQHSRHLNYRQVKRALMDSVTKSEYFANKSISGGILNVAQAVKWEQPIEIIWRLPEGAVTIESCDDLTGAVWNPVEITAGPRDYVITVNPGLPQKFYRYTTQ